MAYREAKGLFFKVYRNLLHNFFKLESGTTKGCHEEVKIKVRLVRRLDGTIPFHGEILWKKDAAAEITNDLSY